MMPGSAVIPRTKATNLDRFIGYFVDCLILIPVYLVLSVVVFMVPGVGSMIVGLIGGVIGAVWLVMRDAKGLSVGKKVMSLEVISKDGGPASEDQLMKRNYTLAAGSALSGVPVVGMLGGAISLIECILLLAKGERYGDQMANTMVVKK